MTFADSGSGTLKVQRSFSIGLGFIIGFAVLIRILVPIYEWAAPENPLYFQFIQPLQYQSVGLGVAIADGLRAGLSPAELDLGHSAMRGEWPFTILVAMVNLFASLVGAPDKFMIFAQIFQGLVDGICGTLAVIAITARLPYRNAKLFGGIIYAVWPPSVFYSFNVCAEGYTPTLVLVGALLFIRALEHERLSHWLGFALFMGLTICFRINNAFIPLLYLFVGLLWRKRAVMTQITVLVVMVVGFVAPYKIFSAAVPIKGNLDLGSVLLNSMGEYPGKFKGIRFFSDGDAAQYGESGLKKYLDSGDRVVSTTWKMYSHDPALHVWIREVPLGKPLLYADTLAMRFIGYLPAHPYVAAIGYFLLNQDGFTARRERANYVGMYGYRYSEIFSSLKFIDYIIFGLFAWGVWVTRRKPIIRTVLCPYFAVHIFHVLTSNGEVFFRLDQEYNFLELRYLLGMVAVWPVFIAASLARFGQGRLSWR